MYFTLLYSHFIDKYVAVAHDLNGFLEILLARDQCQFGMTSFDVFGGRFIERLPVQVVVIFASLRHEVYFLACVKKHLLLFTEIFHLNEGSGCRSCGEFSILE